MTRDKAKYLISLRLGRRPDLYDDIVQEMDLAMTVTLGQDPALDPWFLLTDPVGLQTVPDVATVAVPEEFFLEVEESKLQIQQDDGSWTPLGKYDVDDLETHYVGAEPGSPEAYALTGAYFRLYPTPDAVYNLRFMHRKIAASLLNEPDGENEWLLYAPDLVIAHVAAHMAAEYLQNQELALAIAAGSLKRATDRLIRLNEARAQINHPRTMGGEL